MSEKKRGGVAFFGLHISDKTAEDVQRGLSKSLHQPR